MTSWQTDIALLCAAFVAVALTYAAVHFNAWLDDRAADAADDRLRAFTADWSEPERDEVERIIEERHV